MEDITKLSKQIGKRLLLLRKKKNISQTKLIESIGGETKLSLRSYIDYEKGKRVMDLEKLILLAEYHSVSLDYLVYGKNIVDLDEYSWKSSLMMLSRLISSYVIIPMKISDKEHPYCGKYSMFVPDTETCKYLDLCGNAVETDNYLFKRLNGYPENLPDRLVKIITDNHFDQLNDCLKISEKRVNKYATEIGVFDMNGGAINVVEK